MTDSDREAPPSRGEEGGGRVVRHRGLDRLYHWTMAAAVLMLIFTGFLPVVGVKFSWVTPHWIAGVVLAALVAHHIVRAVIWQDFRAMMIGLADLRNAWRSVCHTVARRGPPPGKPGKYLPLQKVYHWATAVIVLGLVVTGLLMLPKVDTSLWRRNPYWFSEAGWGVIYAVHGLAGMASIALVMVHIYFGLRPEKRWITRSMIRGWITREEYLAHHDPGRWPVAEAEPAAGQRGGKARRSIGGWAAWRGRGRKERR